MNTTTLVDIIQTSFNRGDSPELTVISGSMSPLLKAGDSISLELVQSDLLSPGDIITFVDSSIPELQNALQTHRFYGFHNLDGEPRFVTRGDRSLFFDPILPASAIVGRVSTRTTEDRILDFNDQPGNVLNRIMAILSGLELFVTTGIRSPSSGYILNRVPLINDQRAARQNRLSFRITRRIVRFMADSTEKLLPRFMT